MKALVNQIPIRIRETEDNNVKYVLDTEEIFESYHSIQLKDTNRVLFGRRF